MDASVSGRTDTRVLVDAIDAASAHTRIGLTLVNLVLAELSVVAVSTAAFVALGERLAVAILARVRTARVDWFIAVVPSKSGITPTLVAVFLVDAGARHAWIGQTLVDVCAAVVSSPAAFAVASPAVDEVSTVAALARTRCTLVDV
jgi:hypothetical protein